MTVNAWSVVRYIEKLGSPMNCAVKSIEPFDKTYSIIHVDTTSKYPAIMTYNPFSDNPIFFDDFKLPSIGEVIKTVVFNFVAGQLYLTANPSELEESRIAQWQQYYEFIDTIAVGDNVNGIVTRMEPFGLFVDIGAEFIGLIDVGHSKLFSTQNLPSEQSD